MRQASKTTKAIGKILSYTEGAYIVNYCRWQYWYPYSLGYNSIAVNTERKKFN